MTSANLYITQNQVQKIERAVGANLVIPVYSTSDQITVGPDKGRVNILGLKPDTIQTVLVVTNGTYIRGGDSVLVGPTLASNFNLKTGSRIKIGSSTNSTETVRVVGHSRINRVWIRFEHRQGDYRH